MSSPARRFLLAVIPMPSDSARVGVAVPAYRPDLDRLRPYIDDLQESVADELVIALDDPAPDIVAHLRQHYRVDVSDTRRGKGAALTDAFDTLAPDVDRLVFADADASTLVDSVAAIVSALDGTATVAVGTRRHPDANVRTHQSLIRRSLGAGFTQLARRLLDVHLTDYQCGAKALTTDAWRTVRPHLHEPGFAWDVELLAVADALDERITEVPICWTDRPGKTVAPVQDTVSMARGLLAARERANTLRGSPSPLARVVCQSAPLLDARD